MGKVAIFKMDVNKVGEIIKWAEKSLNSNESSYYFLNGIDKKIAEEQGIIEKSSNNESYDHIILMIVYEGTEENIREMYIGYILSGEKQLQTNEDNEAKLYYQMILKYKMPESERIIKNLLQRTDLDLTRDYGMGSYLSVYSMDSLYAEYKDRIKEAENRKRKKEIIEDHFFMDKKEQFRRDRELIVRNKSFRRMVDKAQIYGSSKYKACEEYIKLFHTRNFYRNLIERTRFKPDERLWEIWFGNNTLFYGIMLSPVFRNGKWTNDVSEIRRTRYQYWTVEHILQAGIVSPEIPSPYRFAGLEDFLEFYGHVIIRLSHSVYERQIMKKYVEYLKNKKDYQSVPFLIPELRYLGINAKHQYRLDFTILNSHTRDMIGFEISPQSSHMQIDRIQGKTKDEMNVELRIKWEREMSKRNDYFKDLGISIITFTDKDLLNIDSCFEKMKEFLEKRNKKPINLEEEISILKCL